MKAQRTLPPALTIFLAILPGTLMILTTLWMRLDTTGVNVTFFISITLWILGTLFVPPPRSWLLPAAASLFSLLVSGYWFYVIAQSLALNPNQIEAGMVLTAIQFGTMSIGVVAVIVILISYWKSQSPDRWLTIILFTTICLSLPLSFLMAMDSSTLRFADLWRMFLFSGIYWGTPLLTVAISTRLARTHEIAATLFVTSAAFFLWQELLDIDYSIWGAPWTLVTLSLFAMWVLIVTPAWVLLARSTMMKTVGLLVPPLIGLTLMVVMVALIRTEPQVLDNFVNLRAYFPEGEKTLGEGIQPGKFWEVLLSTKSWMALQLYLTLVLAVLLNRGITAKFVDAQATSALVVQKSSVESNAPNLPVVQAV